MKPAIQTLHNVWSSSRAIQSTANQEISFSELTNSIVSTGPFYFFIIDFYDMSVSHISDDIVDIHGFNPAETSLNTIIDAIHPDDIGFVIRAEEFLSKFFMEDTEPQKLMSYKNSYNFRARNKNGGYTLFNHQALMLTLDETGRYGKSLNIHTCIDHITVVPNYKISLIGLHGEPSYMNLNIDNKIDKSISFSKREIDIIKNIAEGLDSLDIANKLFIAESTVKKHRQNILEKSGCKNTAQLVKNCILQGLI